MTISYTINQKNHHIIHNIDIYRYYPQFTRNHTPQNKIISSFSALSSINVLPISRITTQKSQYFSSSAVGGFCLRTRWWPHGARLKTYQAYFRTAQQSGPGWSLSKNALYFDGIVYTIPWLNIKTKEDICFAIISLQISFLLIMHPIYI